MTVKTSDTANLTAVDEFAGISYVPGGADVVISLSGINGHVVKLQAKWNQEGSTFETQKTFTSDPQEAQHFEAPIACTLRLGVPTGDAFGSGNVSAGLRFEYPLKKR